MPDKVGILSSRRGYHAKELEEAILRRGADPAFFNINRLAGWVCGDPNAQVRGESLDDCRALLVRTIPTGSLEQIIFRMDVLHRLQRIGVKVINPASAIERTVDKYYTSFLLADEGIPTPRTLVTEDFETAFNACRAMGDVVIKPLFGSEGKGMVRASDEETAYRILRAWELNRYIYYIQEYLPHFDEDVRAFVVGTRVVAAMMRRGTGWKTNYSRGADLSFVTLSPEMESLAIKAVQAIGLDYAGVDLMRAEDGGEYVVEVNSIPGWKGLRKISGMNIADHIVDYVLQKIHSTGPESAENLRAI
jgi:RimK family alpha-L-glutamate ligase